MAQYKRIEVLRGYEWREAPFEMLQKHDRFRNLDPEDNLRQNTAYWIATGNPYPIEGEPGNWGINCYPIPMPAGPDGAFHSGMQAATSTGDAMISQLPEWKCHKVVRAAKITKADYGHFQIQVEVDGNTVTVEPGSTYFAQHKPHEGGYVVAYKDGYLSYSPAVAFEEGYTKITP